MEEGEVYCQFVDKVVKTTEVSKYCVEYFKNGKCLMCKTSPQISLGMPVADLLRQMRECA